MKQNKAYHDNFRNNTLPDKSVQLIIADPPYFEVKGEFDFIWNSFDDYLQDVEIWAIECKRLLADNGTLFWYGDAKKIAYSQIILDRYFNLLSNVTIHVIDRQTNKITVEDARSFISTTERVLMYSNEINRTGLEEIKLDVNNFKPLRDYFEYLQKSIPSTKKIILETIGTVADHCFRWGSSQWDMPTLETYNELIKHFKIDQLEKFQQYEELRRQYEELRRPFNPNEAYKMDVLRVSQEGHITGKYDHDTVKPLKLSRVLIQTCSRPNDLVFVPFAGSGTECEAAAIEGRPFIAFDIEKKYVDMTNKRVRPHLQQQTIFDQGA
jgi:DNA modification methylase